MRCCVPFCTSYVVNKKLTDEEKQQETLKFFQIPSKADVREKWLKNIAKRDWLPSDRSTVCSLHFEPDDFKLGLKVAKLKPDAVPSVFPHYPKYMQEAAKKLCKTRRQPKIRTAPQIKKRKKVRKPSTPLNDSISNASVTENISSNRLCENADTATENNSQMESNATTQNARIESNGTSENAAKSVQMPHTPNSPNDGNSRVTDETNSTNVVCKELLFAIHDHSLLTKPLPTPTVPTNNNLNRKFVNPEDMPKRGRPAMPYAELKKQLSYYKQRTWWLNKKVEELNKKNKTLKAELKEKRKYDQNVLPPMMINRNIIKEKLKVKSKNVENKQARNTKFCTVYCISADV